ncbi:DNA polymerase I [Nymphaea thermarum]|nr:DNA polymerase I [Nymphaea thermarum]
MGLGFTAQGAGPLKTCPPPSFFHVFSPPFRRRSFASCPYSLPRTGFDRQDIGLLDGDNVADMQAVMGFNRGVIDNAWKPMNSGHTSKHVVRADLRMSPTTLIHLTKKSPRTIPSSKGCSTPTHFLVEKQIPKAQANEHLSVSTGTMHEGSKWVDEEINWLRASKLLEKNRRVLEHMPQNGFVSNPSGSNATKVDSSENTLLITGKSEGTRDSIPSGSGISGTNSHAVVIEEALLDLSLHAEDSKPRVPSKMRDCISMNGHPLGMEVVKNEKIHYEVNGAVPGVGLNRKNIDDEISNSEDIVETSIGKENVREEFGSYISDDRMKLSRLYDKVLVVDNVATAKVVVEKLIGEYRSLVHACDTEVAKIDVKQETPAANGELICFSVYSGKGTNFGDDKTAIWVDILDGGRDVLMAFAPFFEDPGIKKVWHNYSFDCHVLENHGIKVSGFHADTMHLARLWDSSRRMEGGYSLEALTGDPKVMSESGSIENNMLMSGKISMKTVFGRRKLRKDGSEGKIVSLAPVEELQKKERIPWICYSVRDSITTLDLFMSLKEKLMKMEWKLDGARRGNMYDFYEEYWRPFGVLLVEMESEGMLVDRKYLSDLEKIATNEQKIAADRFTRWASKYCPDALYMNVGSDAQLRQLFFGGTANSKDPNEHIPCKRTFRVPNVDYVLEKGKKAAPKYRNIELHLLKAKIRTEMYTPSGWPSVSSDALKTFAGKISAELYDVMGDDYDFQSNNEKAADVEQEAKSVAQVSEDVYGSAFHAFGGGEEGKKACHAIAALCEMSSIDALISNFILPLQGKEIMGKNGRIHCSLNINTETGRLSCRRPNLQNQPALEKDRYKIRQAFIAQPGNSLIVADYGQLELRILAHLSNCKSMLNAFRAGGDFHSRTAMNMYTHIREAVEKNQVLLEWSPKPGEEKPPAPLLKDAFASERRKAKMLNFSIAYGKTAMGLARDWKVSIKEAKETVELWYKERQEVLKWQEERKNEAHKKHSVHTLLGRARRFPSLDNASSALKSHIERAAINTPVQGSAADVAMCAMLEISRNSTLKELGWKLILQVHDEVILEGPTETAEFAKSIVVECMSRPFYGTNFLRVDLAVDAKCAANWYSAK